MENSENFLDKLSRLTESEGVKIREATLARQHEEQAHADKEIDAVYGRMIVDRTDTELEKQWAETRSIAWFAADVLRTVNIKPANFIDYLPTYRRQGWLRKNEVFVGNEDHYAFDGWVLERYPDYLIDRFARAGYSNLSSAPADGYEAALVLRPGGGLGFTYKSATHEPHSFKWSISALPGEDVETQTILHAGILHATGKPYDGSDLESTARRVSGDELVHSLNITPLSLVEISHDTLCMHEDGDDSGFSKMQHEDSKRILLERLRPQVNLATEIEVRIAHLLASHAINVK